MSVMFWPFCSREMRHIRGLEKIVVFVRTTATVKKRRQYLQVFIKFSASFSTHGTPLFTFHLCSYSRLKKILHNGEKTGGLKQMEMAAESSINIYFNASGNSDPFLCSSAAAAMNYGKYVQQNHCLA